MKKRTGWEGCLDERQYLWWVVNVSIYFETRLTGMLHITGLTTSGTSTDGYLNIKESDHLTQTPTL